MRGSSHPTFAPPGGDRVCRQQLLVLADLILLPLCLLEGFASAPEKQQVSLGERCTGLAVPSLARVGAQGARAGGAWPTGAQERPLPAGGSGTALPSPALPYSLRLQPPPRALAPRAAAATAAPATMSPPPGHV